MKAKTDASCKTSVGRKRTATRKSNSAFNACVGISALMVCRDKCIGDHPLFERALAMQGGQFSSGPIVDIRGRFRRGCTNTTVQHGDRWGYGNGISRSGHGSTKVDLFLVGRTASLPLSWLDSIAFF